MLKALIVEDEKQIQETIASIIKLSFNDIELVGFADSIQMAKSFIKDKSPDLVFLDVQLKDGLSFELLQQLDHFSFKIIFITSHEQYALQAFKQSAIDYLIKPIESSDLVQAVYRARESMLKDEIYKVKFLVENFEKREENKNKKILINSQESLLAIEVNDIVRCEASSNYTIIYLSNHKQIVVSKTLKEILNLFNCSNIVRTHKSHLINLDFFKKIDKKIGDMIELSNNNQVPIGKTYRNDFINQIELHSKK